MTNIGCPTEPRDVFAVLQQLADTAATGVLRFEASDGSTVGGIWFEDGLVVHAERGRTEGPEAARACIESSVTRGGGCQLERGVTDPRRSVDGALSSYEHVLLPVVRNRG